MSTKTRAAILRQKAKLYGLTVESCRMTQKRRYDFIAYTKTGGGYSGWMAFTAQGIGEAERLLDAYQQGYDACRHSTVGYATHS